LFYKDLLKKPFLFSLHLLLTSNLFTYSDKQNEFALLQADRRLHLASKVLSTLQFQ